MIQEKKSPNYSQVAGVLFVIAACFQLMNGFSFMGILVLACYAAIAYACLSKKNDLVLTIGIAVMALLTLYSFFAGFANDIYKIGDWSYRKGYTYEFNLFCMLPALATLIGSAMMALIAVCNCTNYLPNCKEICHKYWWLPAALLGGASVFALLVWFFVMLDGNEWYTVIAYISLPPILKIFGFLYIALWLEYPDGLPSRKTNSNGYYSIPKHALLCAFTFYIWMFIWVHRTTKYLNRAEGMQTRNATHELLLCMFVPFYSVYWIYKSCQYINKIAKDANVEGELTGLVTILSFVGFVSLIIMQDKINQIALAESAAVSEE